MDEIVLSYLNNLDVQYSYVDLDNWMDGFGNRSPYENSFDSILWQFVKYSCQNLDPDVRFMTYK